MVIFIRDFLIFLRPKPNLKGSGPIAYGIGIITIYIYIQNKHQPSMSRQLLENSGCQIFPFWGMMKFDSKMYDTIKTLPYSALSLGLVSEFLTRVSIILFIFNCARVDQLP